MAQSTAGSRLSGDPFEAIITLLALEELGSVAFLHWRDDQASVVPKFQALLATEGLPLLTPAEQADLAEAGEMGRAEQAAPFDAGPNWLLLENWLNAWLSMSDRQVLYVDAAFGLSGLIIVTAEEFCRWSNVAIGPDVGLKGLSNEAPLWDLKPKDCEVIS